MTGKEIVEVGNKNKLTCVFLLLLLISFPFSSGCTKEQVAETKGVSCIIYDKLPDDVTKKVEINFGNKIKLLGANVKKLSPNQLEVSYFWQVVDKMDRFKNIYVHFADASNNVLFQNDHEFCAKKTFEELKGKIVKEVFVVGVPQSAKGKEVFLKLGVYVPEPNGPRLKIESAGGAILDEKDTRASVEKVSL